MASVISEPSKSTPNFSEAAEQHLEFVEETISDVYDEAFWKDDTEALPNVVGSTSPDINDVERDNSNVSREYNSSLRHNATP